MTNEIQQSITSSDIRGKSGSTISTTSRCTSCTISKTIGHLWTQKAPEVTGLYAITPRKSRSSTTRCDEWICDKRSSTKVLQNFSMMTVQDRTRFVLGCMDIPPKCMDAWLNGCAGNWRIANLERRLTAQLETFSTAKVMAEKNSGVGHGME